MDSIATVLSGWRLENAAVAPIDSYSHDTWDIGGEYVLKRYRNNGEARHSVRLSGLLLAEDVLVSEYVPDKNGRRFSPDGLHCLMTKLSGEHIDFFKRPSLAAVMGRELAKLHRALAKIEPEVSCHDINLLAEWHETYMPGVRGLLADGVINQVEAELGAAWPKLPRQLIHRDVHPQNVLFEDERLTGWLDFDLGQKNARLFDPAYLLSGLLLGNTGDPGKIKIWRALYRDVLAGYDEINPLTREERDALPVLMIVIECLFVWYWGTQGNAEQRGVALSHAEWLYNNLLDNEGYI